MKSLNKEEIFKLLKQHREELKNFNVIKLGLFGSVLRGNNTKQSDIDFIVEFEEGKKNYDLIYTWIMPFALPCHS